MNEVTTEMWKSLRSWALVTLALLMVAIFIAIPVTNEVKKQIAADLSVIHEQNKRSIDDRAYMHEELANTREALKRLEAKK